MAACDAGEMHSLVLAAGPDGAAGCVYSFGDGAQGKLGLGMRKIFDADSWGIPGEATRPIYVIVWPLHVVWYQHSF